MSKVNLNKKSVKQQGGQMIPGQPGMQSQQPTHQMPDGTMMPGATHGEQQGGPSMMQPQQQVDPQVMQISQFFAQSIEQGGQPEEVVINLMQQEIDQNTIAQALMTVGYQEADITALFQSVQEMTQPKPASASEVNRNPQELARNQQIASEQQGPVAVDPIDMAQSGIEIKPENKGKFTRWAKSRGMSVSQAANTVMSNTDSYSPSVVKMANFAKNAAGWKKQEGGEQEAYEPHFMYKGERKIRAKDMATHLRLKDAGYSHKAQEGTEITDNMVSNATLTGADPIDPVITAPAPKLTPQQVKDNEQMSAFLAASKVQSINGQDLSGNIKQNDEGIIGSTNYFSPNAFKTGNNFSLGKAANVLNEGYTNMFSGKDENEDGVKDGSFRDWKGKTELNKANKLANTTYDVELDVSEENKAAAEAWKTQFDIENPEKDALGNLVVEEKLDDLGNPIEVKEQPIDAFSSWLNKGAEGLKGKALETFNSLKEKYGSSDVELDDVMKDGGSLPQALFGFNKRARKAMQDPMSVARVAAGDFSAMQNLMMEGGPLTKAQFSTPDSGSPFADPIAADVSVGPDQPLSFQEWVMEDPVTRGTADGNTRYQEYVDGYNSTEPTSVDATTPPPAQRTAADLFGDINAPEVTANTGGLEGAADRFINSKAMTAFGDVSDFAVKGADVVNDWFEDKNIKDAKDDMRANLNADSIYGTKTDAFNKRGTTDVNTGIMGSEGDRTTGLYMSKQGGEAAYLANRDRVIKREMAKAQDGNEVGKNHPYYKEYLEKFNEEGMSNEKDILKILLDQNITPMDTLMVNGAYDTMNARRQSMDDVTRFIAKDIYDDGTGNFEGPVGPTQKKPYFTSESGFDFMKEMYKADNYDGLNNVIGTTKSKQPNNDASLMKLFGMQQGGETVNVNSEMLAKLIAAGADIEML